ncbi:MAG TPA: tRNA(Ile)(2)-agmatinylcytidine synthase [Thermoplasmata archaeon]|nr:tRNA(Ile)(2)-agmatinylcytidine synthase [Thermoplasmata archaeon]
MAAPVWVGIDDTDGADGGCTTFALTELVETARSSGLDLIGEPRLVRLNPNVPFKTRGNAALSARFGIGEGSRRLQGRGRRGAIWSYGRGRGPPPHLLERFLDLAWENVRRSARLGGPGSDPALVATSRQLPAGLYRTAVARVIDRAELVRELEQHGAWVRADGSGQGVVGAASAISWPARRATWELIAYRASERWGTPRSVDRGSVQEAQHRFPDLFLCHDPRTRRLLVAPHTGCPILLGLRSRSRRRLARAFAVVRSEPAERWMVFRTNQGTGDHLVPREIADLQPFDAARVTGQVAGPARLLRGGHAHWTISDRAGRTLECVAFEPTKTLPRVAGGLAAGDVVEVWGGRAADPVFRVEGIRLLRPARRAGPSRPPACPRCGRRMGSIGRARGYRCRSCSLRLPPERAEWPVQRGLAPGTYHPTPSARRHLAPLGPEGVDPVPSARGLVTDLYGS